MQYKAGTCVARGVRVPDKPGKGVADPMRDERRVPEHRLYIRVLVLAAYDVPAPHERMITAEIKEVKLMLRQNIGAPCVPSVKVGDAVSAGQIRSQPRPKGALGCLPARQLIRYGQCGDGQLISVKAY